MSNPEFRVQDVAEMDYLTAKLGIDAKSAYFGKPEKLRQIREILKPAAIAMQRLTIGVLPPGCPWNTCPDGSCRPICDIHPEINSE